MTGRQDVYLAGGFERGGRDGVQAFVHGEISRNRSTNGSGMPASAKPLARSTQAGHSPQGGCRPW